MSVMFTIPKFKIWIVTLETFNYENNTIFNAIVNDITMFQVSNF